jgi:pyruvate kinase
VDEHGLPDGHSPDYVPVGGKVPADRRVKPGTQPVKGRTGAVL